MSSPLARLRARSEPAPSYALRHAYAGVHRLNPALTLNGVTAEPTVRYRGGDATIAAWPAWGYGGAFTIAGAGANPSINQGSPLFGVSDDAVTGGGGKYYAATGAIADPSPVNKVLVVECVLRSSVVAIASMVTRNNKTIVSVVKGWAIAPHTNGNTYFSLGDGVAVQYGAVFNAIGGQFAHLIFAYRNGGATSQVYSAINGVRNTYYAALAIGDITPAAPEAAPFAALYAAGQSLSYLATWAPECAALDPAALDVLAASRFAALVGDPTVAQGSALPDVMTRSSPAHVDKWVGANRRIFYVGANWPSLSSRKDSAGRTLVGIAPDLQRTNLCLQSQTLNTTWTKVALTSITDNSGVGPDGTAVLDGIIGTAVDTQHGVSQAIALTATTYAISCWVRAGNKSWAYLSDDTVAGATAYFQLTGDGVLGTKGAGALTSGIESWGGGLYRIWITVTGTAAPHTIVAYAAEADGDNSFAGDAATINLHLGCCQVIAGNFPAAYIPTTTGAVTKTVENHRYPGLANIGGIGSEKQGAIRFKLLATPAVLPAAKTALVGMSDGGAAADSILVSVGTDGQIDAESAATAGAAGASAGPAINVCDGASHDIYLEWEQNRLLVSVDRVPGTVDAACDMPDDLDRLEIGQDSTGAAQGGILIGDVKVFQRPLHSPIIQGSGFRD